MADKPLILYQSVMPEDYSQILALLTGPFTDQEPLNQSGITTSKDKHNQHSELSPSNLYTNSKKVYLD